MLITARICRLVVPAENVANGYEEQRVHQSSSFAELPRILERVVAIRQCGLGVAEHP